MVNERTEDQKIARAPIVVTLGGKEYEIALLVIRDSREWRKKVIGLIAPLPKLVKVTMEDSEDFENVLTQMMVTLPDQVGELFFEYAKELDRDEIEAVATDEELSKAFEQVINVTFPLAASLPKVMARLSE